MKNPLRIKKPILIKTELPWILKTHGFKVTPSRVEILHFFLKHSKPASAEQVFAALKKNSKNKIDQATVYRTVASFEETGILKRVDLRTGAVLYELPRHHHHHLICIECGLIEDIDLCDIEVASKKLLRQSKKFATIKDHSLELFGICKACAKA